MLRAVVRAEEALVEGTDSSGIVLGLLLEAGREPFEGTPPLCSCARELSERLGSHALS